MTHEDEATRKMQFLFQLRSKGVTDVRVLEAMERIDRGDFVKGHFEARAYEDMPLPIASGQTISQPSVVDWDIVLDSWALTDFVTGQKNQSL